MSATVATPQLHCAAIDHGHAALAVVFRLDSQTVEAGGGGLLSVASIGLIAAFIGGPPV